ncbi:MAG: SDR family oxidoreductase [Fimbriimonadaceae bacterium]|nr:SDR family oxidoreductase [Fimbriimonadaceae bacterium]
MAGRVAGKVCLVTGSTSGIGEGLVRRLAAEGGRVVVSGRRVALGEALASDLRAAGGEALFMPLDVTDPAQLEAVVGRTVTQCGGLDAVIHNAGLATRGTVVDLTLPQWQAIFETNVTATFLLAKYAVPHLQARGGGSFIGIGSAHTVLPKRNMAGYCASRGAQLMLLRQMAVEYLSDRIRVNLVNPGWVDTPGERELLARLGHGDDVLDKAAAANPFGRLLAPDDIAHLVVYLVSDESALVTGGVFDVHHEHPRVS